MTKLSLAIVLMLASVNTLADENNQWNGPYASLLVGYTNGKVNEKNGLSDYYNSSPDGDDYLLYGGGKTSLTGISGSLKIGYNLIIPENNLIGLEFSSTLQNTKSLQRMFDAYENAGGGGYEGEWDLVAPLNVKTRINNYQTLGFRIGHIFNEETLVCIFSGGAIGRIERELTQAGDVNWFDLGYSTTGRKTETGYVFGLGIEQKINSKLACRLSYEYVDFGKINMTYNGPYDGQQDLIKQSHNLDFSNLSVGLSYQF